MALASLILGGFEKMENEELQQIWREQAERIVELENIIQQKDYALTRLKKGGEFCKSCNGSGLYMNRNAYFETCFTCKGIGATI